jgi:type IV secretion system protein VirB10
MPVTEIGDPRLQALFGASDPRDAGVRPAVRLPRRGLPPVALAAIAIVFGLLLFLVLNERRTSQSEPSVKVRPDSDASGWDAPPPLYVPPETAPVTLPIQPEQQHPQGTPVFAAPAPTPVARPAIVEPVYVPQPLPQMAPVAPAPQPRASGGAPLVIDTGGAPGAAAGSSPGALSSIASQTGASARMRASALANRSTTIAQGTLIQAVLETGFDSTQPGFARAIVSRDVRSFDASNILIPRGSKLIGEYRSDVAQGQKRAVIIWTRLIRPDGMTINMDSPAVDTLGRGGVAASVNTHFFARLGDALLQSTIGIGSALAQRRVAGPVVVLSGSTTAATGPALPANNYVPTLTVPAGKSISVFVAHDLDFSAAGAPR